MKNIFLKFLILSVSLGTVGATASPSVEKWNVYFYLVEFKLADNAVDPKEFKFGHGRCGHPDSGVFGCEGINSSGFQTIEMHPKFVTRYRKVFRTTATHPYIRLDFETSRLTGSRYYIIDQKNLESNPTWSILDGRVHVTFTRLGAR